MAHTSKLSTLMARTALARIEKDSSPLTSVHDIYKTSVRIFKDLYSKFPTVYKKDKDTQKSVIAFILSNVARKAVKVGDITIADFMEFYAMHKARIAVSMNDFGAFGDLLELLVRLYFVKTCFHNWKLLSVKAYGEIDLVSNKLGKVEIGHNGKTLSFGTMFDYMEGDYNAMIYGTFSVEDKEDIYTLCKEGKYIKACDYIGQYMCVWSNKYDFQNDMNNLSRGQGIVVKGDCIQVVYNDSKYKAFQDAIENKKFITLKEFLNK